MELSVTESMEERLTEIRVNADILQRRVFEAGVKLEFDVIPSPG
jgi:hypothetical protein